MTAGWRIYFDQLEAAIQRNIVDNLDPLGQTVTWEERSFNLGQIPNLHSLIPYSMDARKPIFYCNAADGLVGAHIAKAADSSAHFTNIVETLEVVAAWDD